MSTYDALKDRNGKRSSRLFDMISTAYKDNTLRGNVGLDEPEDEENGENPYQDATYKASKLSEKDRAELNRRLLSGEE